MIDNCVWACGSLSSKIRNWAAHGAGVAENYYPAIMFSGDGGVNYTVLWKNQPEYASWDGQVNRYSSKIVFSNKNNGFLTIYWHSNDWSSDPDVWSGRGSIYSYFYKTEDGGKSWTEVPQMK